MSGMRFPQRAGWAPLRPSHRTTRRPSARRSPCFLCRMMQKAPKMLAVMLNCPYLCSTHLQIEGVSGLDRLDAASSPAFFRLACRTPRVDTVECPHFPHKRGHLAAKAPAFQSKSPHFVAPFRPVQAEGGEILPFCQPRGVGTRLANIRAYGSQEQPTGQPTDRARVRTRAPHGAPHNYTFIQQTIKK